MTTRTKWVWKNPESKIKARISRLNSEKTPRGEKHHFWKGEKVSYRSLHKWVCRYKGKPKQCSNCGKIVQNRGIHWANISGEYKRDLNDYIRLCALCHRRFDHK